MAVRLKHVLVALAVVSSSIVTTVVALGDAGPAQAGGSDGGTSSASGVQVTLLSTDLVPPTPSVTLGADGSTDTQSSPSVSLPLVISVGAMNATASSNDFGAATEAIDATSDVANVSGLTGLGILGTPLSVAAVGSSCTSSASGSTGATTITSLSIAGTTLTLPSTIPANTGLDASQLGALSGLVSITLNAQTAQDRPGFSGTSLDVVGLQVTLLSGIDAGAVIDVAHSSCSATGPDIEAAPTVSGLAPAYGPASGGTSVTITGSGFVPTSDVDFGAQAATNVDVVSSAEITADSPADSSITSNTPVAVTVSNTWGTSSSTAGSGNTYTYEATPTVNFSTDSPAGIVPDSGPVAGGTAVTVNGSNFDPADTSTVVDFGTGNPATSVQVVSPTVITAVAPPGSAPGSVSVTVTDAGGTSGGVIYSYQGSSSPPPSSPSPGPSVSGISPTSGPPQGNETVTVRGTNLCGAPSVTFGGAGATVVSVSSDCTTLTVTEPAGQGIVPVTVTTDGGSAGSPESFTYIQPGYWMAAADGGVFAFGGAKFYGSVPQVLAAGQKLNSPIVAMADTPDHGGYWLFAADGGVFTFGDAPFYGSVPGVLGPNRKLNGPVVAAEATPDGRGYRMFAADGGVFDFGDALFEGSLPGEHITPSAPVQAAVSYPFGSGTDPDSAGYWLVGGDGSVYTFGNAPFEGSAVGQIFGRVTAMATTPDGQGYYMFLADGPVAAFGDAVSHLGGASNVHAPIVFGQSTSTGQGYWEFGTDGGVFTYGDAPYEGSMGAVTLNAPITAAIGFGSQG